MADDRLQVDVAALAGAGLNLTEWSELANSIAEKIESAANQSQHAGGTGKMGEMFTKHYKPGEAKAIEFLKLLQHEIGGAGQRVINVAKNFDETNDDASQSAREF